MQLAYDMVDTMREAGGVGLAANQVGDLRRLIVLQIPEEEEARIYFNPEIIKARRHPRSRRGLPELPRIQGHHRALRLDQVRRP